MSSKVNKKLLIDPEQFALAVVSGSNIDTETSDDTSASKVALKRYLNAYFLIEEFNEAENAQFEIDKRIDFDVIVRALAGRNIQ